MLSCSQASTAIAGPGFGGGDGGSDPITKPGDTGWLVDFQVRSGGRGGRGGGVGGLTTEAAPSCCREMTGGSLAKISRKIVRKSKMLDFCKSRSAVVPGRH